MKKETLKDKRKKLMKLFLKDVKSEESGTILSIFSGIEEQDKQFIKDILEMMDFEIKPTLKHNPLNASVVRRFKDLIKENAGFEDL